MGWTIEGCHVTAVIPTDSNVSTKAVALMLATSPRASNNICRNLWDAQIPLAGRLSDALPNPQVHDLASIAQLAGLTVDLTPQDLEHVLSLVPIRRCMRQRRSMPQQPLS